MKTYFIDLREEFELADVKIIPKSSDIIVINIPMRNIFANKYYIERLVDQCDRLYLICRSGVRSEKVRKLYFDDNPKVLSYDGGVRALESDNDMNVDIDHTESMFNFGLQQFIQMVFVFILLTILGLNYFRVDRYFMNIYIVFIIVFILYQLLTKGCLISSILPLTH